MCLEKMRRFQDEVVGGVYRGHCPGPSLFSLLDKSKLKVHLAGAEHPQCPGPLHLQRVKVPWGNAVTHAKTVLIRIISHLFCRDFALDRATISPEIMVSAIQR